MMIKQKTKNHSKHGTSISSTLNYDKPEGHLLSQGS